MVLKIHGNGWLNLQTAQKSTKFQELVIVLDVLTVLISTLQKKVIQLT